MGESRGGGHARGGSRRARGAWGPLDGQVPLSLAHGVHAAMGVCRGWDAGVRERRVRRGGGLGRLARAGQK
jgi:hypothetical protein